LFLNAFFQAQNAPKIDGAAGALPQTPLGELTVPPDLIAGFRGRATVKERGEEGRERGIFSIGPGMDRCL